jgi:hypothetical protein
MGIGTIWDRTRKFWNIGEPTPWAETPGNQASSARRERVHPMRVLVADPPDDHAQFGSIFRRPTVVWLVVSRETDMGVIGTSSSIS